MKTLKQSTLLITGLLLVVVLMLTALTGIAQNTDFKKPSAKDIFPFAKKLPPPLLNSREELMRRMYDKKPGGLPHTYFDSDAKRFVFSAPGHRSLLPPAPFYSKSST